MPRHDIPPEVRRAIHQRRQRYKDKPRKTSQRIPRAVIEQSVLGRKEALNRNEKAKPSVKSLLGKLATVLNFRKASSEEQPAVPENPTKSDAITFDPYPYEEGQLAQLDSNSRFPLLPELNPAEHKELPSSIIEKLNKDIKTDLISYVHWLNGFSDKPLGILPKNTISFGATSFSKSHDFVFLSASARPAPDNQTFLVIHMQTGRSINGTLAREFSFRSPVDPNSFVLRKDALLDLLRNEHTRVIEASRTLEPTDKPRIYHEIVNIKGNLVSVHRHTKSDEDQDNKDG